VDIILEHLSAVSTELAWQSSVYLFRTFSFSKTKGRLIFPICKFEQEYLPYFFIIRNSTQTMVAVRSPIYRGDLQPGMREQGPSRIFVYLGRRIKGNES
jgi:hypothetical protein